MVKLREKSKLFGVGDLHEWLQTAVKIAELYESGERGLSTAETLNDLGLDMISIIAGMVYPAIQSGKYTISQAEKDFDLETANLLRGVAEMDQVHAKNPLKINPEQQAKDNLHNLRKMLLAVVEDVRVVLIKLALHSSAMHSATKSDDEIKRKLAHEAREIYAPLANRLGIGQIKWELEDFAFRFLEPDIYKKIASLLAERRLDREKYIKKVTAELTEELKLYDINSEIYSRVKHIYSIWRKMQRKMISYNEVYDVRALRIIVDSVKDCYAALGVIHNLWQHIPTEFDDYIANPKSNGYQSLHTAVVGPESKILEVQIRTKEMHEQAELGVAAHWRYKEGSEHEPYYEEKLKQLRQILDWQDELVLETDAVEALRSEFFADRVYVFTPSGDVFDLPSGATPLDFAYHVHTEIGHRCRGAKVNGKIVQLTHALSSGDHVEILTAKEGTPSRDWLSADQHYIVTSKARAKIQQWFKKQNRDQNIIEGKEIIQREFKRLGLSAHGMKDLHQNIANCNSEEDMYAALGSGDIKMSQILGAFQRLEHPDGLQKSIVTHKKELDEKKNEIVVEGVSNLLSHMAKCCKPIPGDQIIGYITLGEGIAIHRQDCLNILHTSELKKPRLIAVRWGLQIQNTYEVEIKIQAYNRRGLISDITGVFAHDGVDILSMTSSAGKDSNIANLKLHIAVTGISDLSKVLTKIQQVPNVVDVYRSDN